MPSNDRGPGDLETLFFLSFCVPPCPSFPYPISLFSARVQDDCASHRADTRLASLPNADFQLHSPLPSINLYPHSNSQAHHSAAIFNTFCCLFMCQVNTVTNEIGANRRGVLQKQLRDRPCSLAYRTTEPNFPGTDYMAYHSKVQSCTVPLSSVHLQ